MSEGSIWDAGLQPERTELAWRRTALAIGVGSLVSMRVLPEMAGDPLWLLAGVGGVVFSAFLWVGARRRYRLFQAGRNSTNPLTPGAAQLLGLALFLAVSAAFFALLLLGTVW